MQKRKMPLLRIILFIFITVLAVFVALNLVPLFKEVIQNRSNENKMVNYMQKYGYKAVHCINNAWQALQISKTVFSGCSY